jgi:hypothetical protein
VCMCVCVYVCMCVCVYVCMCVCVYVCVSLSLSLTSNSLIFADVIDIDTVVTNIMELITVVKC